MGACFRQSATISLAKLRRAGEDGVALRDHVLDQPAPAPPPPDNPTPVETMAHRLKTPEGKKLYALRKQTPEPVFGIIKSALGFRQFLLRGLDNVRGEWNLVTMAYNMKRIFALAGAS